jgi:hypothetical protein
MSNTPENPFYPEAVEFLGSTTTFTYLERVGADLDPETTEKFSSLAKREGIAPSELLKRVIEQALLDDSRGRKRFS